MGLFDFLRGNFPSSDWVRNPNLRIEVDLDHHTLCGVPLGQSTVPLRGLGPAASAAAAKIGSFDYPPHGLSFSDEGGILAEFTLNWNEVGGAQPFTGPVHALGQSFQLHGRTTEEQFTAFFGEPHWREFEEDGDFTLYCERSTDSGAVEWQVYFSGEALLDTLSVSMCPEMAELAYRQMTGCDRPWPPQCP
ncbi:hypothetical protein JXA47_16350 [Candidatus Sumerlaeota bacterium]|nr:hypothetical protein [Candidatus Sumerlaeota bacterium]